MDAGTWVALVIGVGSLVTTLVLDARNRGEREGRDQRERDERSAIRQQERDERTSSLWLDERRALYGRAHAVAAAHIDAVRALARSVHRAPDAAMKDAQRVLDHDDELVVARGDVAMLAPPHVVESFVNFVHVLQTYQDAAALLVETASDDAAWQTRMRYLDEMEAVAVEHAQVSLDAMRTDLGLQPVGERL